MPIHKFDVVLGECLGSGGNCGAYVINFMGSWLKSRAKPEDVFLQNVPGYSRIQAQVGLHSLTWHTQDMFAG